MVHFILTFEPEVRLLATSCLAKERKIYILLHLVFRPAQPVSCCFIVIYRIVLMVMSCYRMFRMNHSFRRS